MNEPQPQGSIEEAAARLMTPPPEETTEEVKEEAVSESSSETTIEEPETENTNEVSSDDEVKATDEVEETEEVTEEQTEESATADELAELNEWLAQSSDRYGDLVIPTKINGEEGKVKLADIVNSTVKAGGHIVVPSFALQRAQEILYHMNKLLLEGKIPDIPVYLDSPMAIRITEVFKQHRELYDKEMTQMVNQDRSPFDFPGLKMVQSTEESKQLNFLTKPAMIIAGSGMCTGGRIKHHLVNNITRPESTILFVGYQAVGTLGRSIVDGIKKVRILGQRYPVQARIAEITGFSAHADKSELLEWMSGINPRRVFIVHGETKSAKEFGKFLRQERGWKVSVPMYGESAALD